MLSACGRGHNAAQSIDAMKRVKKAGFELGGQMMTGLPESTREDELETARAICCCGADCSRIYPTVVLRGTKLYELAREGKYIPRTREESAEDAASAYRVFFDHGVNVLRVGLCANEGLSDEDCFGSFDPAVGEMCLSIIYRDEIEKKLVSSLPPRGSQIKIYVPEGDVSQAVGQNKSNRIYLTVKYGLSRIGFYENCSLTRFEAEIEVD
ncbi:hypothetical protein SDC9_62790 [bioreactor metagenome]|uniref:Radical SAM C-terminal extension domain-containing protein n=1 Tax=bioreactor metagenome TaxID=1076179 RepID=A0A644XKP0_9ZZZZ